MPQELSGVASPGVYMHACVPIIARTLASMNGPQSWGANPIFPPRSPGWEQMLGTGGGGGQRDS